MFAFRSSDQVQSIYRMLSRSTIEEIRANEEWKSYIDKISIEKGKKNGSRYYCGGCLERKDKSKLTMHPTHFSTIATAFGLPEKIHELMPELNMNLYLHSYKKRAQCIEFLNSSELASVIKQIIDPHQIVDPHQNLNETCESFVDLEIHETPNHFKYDPTSDVNLFPCSIPTFLERNN